MSTKLGTTIAAGGARGSGAGRGTSSALSTVASARSWRTAAAGSMPCFKVTRSQALRSGVGVARRRSAWRHGRARRDSKSGSRPDTGGHALQDDGDDVVDHRGASPWGFVTRRGPSRSFTITRTPSAGAAAAAEPPSVAWTLTRSIGQPQPRRPQPDVLETSRPLPLRPCRRRPPAVPIIAGRFPACGDEVVSKVPAGSPLVPRSSVVGRLGLEPRTSGLKVRCSAN